MRTPLLKRVLAVGVGALCLGATAISHAAEPSKVHEPVRVGYGQDSAKEPIKIRNLGLDKPEIAQKYEQDADLIRLLRAAYSEACARGTLAKTLSQLRLDPQHRNKPEVQDVTARLLDGKRIWKMSTFELEVAFGKDYLQVANYCDCLMLELSNKELTHPRKGLEVLDKLPKPVLNSCQKIADEQTQQQLKKYKPVKLD